MDKEKALDFTIERIDSIKRQTFTNESELKSANETLEYLEFIKNLLEKGE